MDPFGIEASAPLISRAFEAAVATCFSKVIELGLRTGGVELRSLGLGLLGCVA